MKLPWVRRPATGLLRAVLGFRIPGATPPTVPFTKPPVFDPPETAEEPRDRKP